MFLRCERFDCEKAAVRICRFSDMMYDLYDDVGLERLTKLSDLEDEEMLILKQGCSQLFPGRDRAGRRVYVHFFSSTWALLTIKSRLRVVVYFFMNLLSNDVVSQRRGIVVVFWNRTENPIKVNDFIARGKVASRGTTSLPIRFAATHLCFPSLESAKSEALVHMISGIASQIKPRLRIHSGSPVECFYTLVSFGITSTQIPLNIASNKLDLTNHSRWLKLCVARENDAELQKRIVECPNNSDILFGRGQILMNHPGNISLRNFIQSNLKAYSDIRTKKETTQFTLAAVRMLKTKYGARFLKEERIDRTITTWVEVSDHLARSKLRISFRDAKSRLAKRKEKGTTATNNEPLPLISSSLFSKRDNSKISTPDDNFKGKNNNLAIQGDFLSLSIPQQQQQEHLKADKMQEFSSNMASLNASISELNSSNLKALTNHQISESSTYTFLRLDGSSDTKRQRICSQDCFNDL